MMRPIKRSIAELLQGAAQSRAQRTCRVKNAQGDAQVGNRLELAGAGTCIMENPSTICVSEHSVSAIASLAELLRGSLFL